MRLLVLLFVIFVEPVEKGLRAFALGHGLAEVEALMLGALACFGGLLAFKLFFGFFNYGHVVFLQRVFRHRSSHAAVESRVEVENGLSKVIEYWV